MSWLATGRRLAEFGHKLPVANRGFAATSRAAHNDKPRSAESVDASVET
jgi:hypothetical protein